MAQRSQMNMFRIASWIFSKRGTSFKSSRLMSSYADSSVNHPPYDERYTEPIQSKNVFLKRYALYIGYQGGDFMGFVMNPYQSRVSFVGKKIVEAFIKAGYLDESALNSQKSICPVSRTDRGVSALCQVAVIDLPDDVNLQKVKEYLPETIWIYGMTRTTNRFIPHNYCSARTYLYYIPSYVFSPHTIEMDKGYRLDSETIERINGQLQKFVGMKNYHNFTRGRTFQDPRSRRKILSIGALDPVIVDGYEMACIRLHGESFILNQIRKMIGAVVAVVRGYVPDTLIDLALSKQGLVLSRAPPHGLLLDSVCLDNYNKRFGHAHKLLDWSSYYEEISSLKKLILSDIVSLERKYEPVKLWTEQLQFHPFYPFNKEEASVNFKLDFDDSLRIIRSEHMPPVGNKAADLLY